MNSLYTQVLDCLMASETEVKCKACSRLYENWTLGQFEQPQEGELQLVSYAKDPGRPSRPALVSPRQLPRRSVHTAEGCAAMLHSFAHIEFNAINLALDAVYRFRGLPAQYYDDWLRIAAEESYHFGLLEQHLKTLGYTYGDFDAHNGLWEMARRTEHDPMVRMAIIPRVMEARGLDVTPESWKNSRQSGRPGL